jgi:hypothetical protein
MRIVTIKVGTSRHRIAIQRKLWLAIKEGFAKLIVIANPERHSGAISCLNYGNGDCFVPTVQDNDRTELGGFCTEGMVI